MLATMRISYTAPYDLEISGAAHELHAIAVALERAGTDWHDLTIRADCSGDAMPYRELLSQVEFQVGYGPVQIGILGQVLRISSSANWLHVLSSYFQNASESLNHAHFEYYDGAEHVAQNSVPLVVAVRDIGAS